MSASPSLTHLTSTSRPQGHRLSRGLAVAAAAGVLAAVAGQLPAMAAPGDTANKAVTAHVAVGSSISFSDGSSDFYLDGVPGATVVGDNIEDYTVTTNNAAGYTVGVQSAAPALTGRSATNEDTIPIANLKVRNVAGDYSSLSDQGPITVATSAVHSAASGDTYFDDYQVAIPFVTSDSYTVVLNYIATAS